MFGSELTLVRCGEALEVFALGRVGGRRADITWAGARFSVPRELTTRRRLAAILMAKGRRVLVRMTELVFLIEMRLVDAKRIETPTGEANG